MVASLPITERKGERHVNFGSKREMEVVSDVGIQENYTKGRATCRAWNERASC